MKKILIVIVCGLLTLAGCGFGSEDIVDNLLSSDSSEEVSEVGESFDAAVTDETASEDASVTMVYVYICGQVNNPGVYEVSENSRIYEVVELAGGLTEYADDTYINLAETVSDEQQIYVPEIGEIITGQTETGQTASAIDSEGRVNINTATITQLMTLAGIGQSKAEAIISYREKHGSFESESDIMNVEGIKTGTYEKIREKITVK